MTMNTIRRTAAVAFVAAALVMAGTTSAQAVETWEGCPAGAVCIYPEGTGFNGGRPSHAFFSYGAHNLKNQFGMHIVSNNQVDGAKARTCTGFNGTGDCQGFMGPQTFVNKDLTPINSIVLVP
jgi:hypothetical protein